MYTFRKLIMMGGLTLAGQTALGQSYHWEDARERVRSSAWMSVPSLAPQSESVPVFVQLPDRLHLVPAWSFTFQGVKLPLDDLDVPERDVYDRATYRSYIDGSRVIKRLEFQGYSDIDWFPFREEVRLAQQCEGVLLGTKEGGRHVLAGIRVVAEYRKFLHPLSSHATMHRVMIVDSQEAWLRGKRKHEGAAR